MRDTINWARLLAFVTGLVHQEVLLQNEYLAGDPRDFGFVHGVVPRFNGSPFYPTKVPDLIGVRLRTSI